MRKMRKMYVVIFRVTIINTGIESVGGIIHFETNSASFDSVLRKSNPPRLKTHHSFKCFLSKNPPYSPQNFTPHFQTYLLKIPLNNHNGFHSGFYSVFKNPSILHRFPQMFISIRENREGV